MLPSHRGSALPRAARAEPSLLEPFISRLDRLGIPYFVTGSTAGILYGEPRLTHGVDLVIALSLRDVQAFVEAFPLEELIAHRPFLEQWIDEVDAGP